MMKFMEMTKRCPSCGCISFPDSRICPKCGKSHIHTDIINEPRPDLNLDNINSLLNFISSCNSNIVINIRDNISISISDRQMIQITQ